MLRSAVVRSGVGRVVALSVVMCWANIVELTMASAAVLPNGVLDDQKISIVYQPDTGDLAIDVPAIAQLTTLDIHSAVGIFTGEESNQLQISCINAVDTELVVVDPGQAIACIKWGGHRIYLGSHDGFGSLRLGRLAQKELVHDFLLTDLSVDRVVASDPIPDLGGSFDNDLNGNVFEDTFGGSFGELEFGSVDGFGPVDLVYLRELQPGDANRDFAFDQRDIVRVLQAGKYLAGEPASWGEGDWNGAPGGYPGMPPKGDGVFDQKDIVAAQQTGLYLSGAHAAIQSGGQREDGRTSLVYDPRTGELELDTPARTELPSIRIGSAAGIFTGNTPINLDGQFDSHDANHIFKVIFGGSFGPLSFGQVAQVGLTEEFVAKDLSVFSLSIPPGEVDLIYVPEPSSWVLVTIIMGTLVLGVRGWQCNRVVSHRLLSVRKHVTIHSPRKQCSLPTAVCFMILMPACASGAAFDNLGFESAFWKHEFDFTTGALPAWTTFPQRIRANLNLIYAADIPQITVFDTLFVGGTGAAEGRFVADIRPGPIQFERPIGIEQTGLVPLEAKSIRLYANLDHAVFDVQLGDRSIPLVELARDDHFIQYVGDVIEQAGTEQTLRISVFPTDPESPDGVRSLLLDGIRFRAEPIPEPPSMVLLLLVVSFLRRLPKRRIS